MGAPHLGEHKKVVTVQMHWMQGWEFVVDDYSDRGVVVKIVDVPLLRRLSAEMLLVRIRVTNRVVGVRCIAGCCEQEHRMVVIGTEGLAIHEPKGVARRVLAQGDVEVEGCSRIRQGREREQRAGLGQVILSSD